MVNEDIGHPDGVAIFDESGYQKKGDDSIGVAKQYCGTLGKVENCQVGVFAAYASPHGYALLDKRLFILKFQQNRHQNTVQLFDRAKVIVFLRPQNVVM